METKLETSRDDFLMESASETASVVAPRSNTQNRILRHISKVLFALAIVCVVLGVLMIFQSVTGGPGLTALAAFVDLGEVGQGETLAVIFKLLNRTNRPIRIIGAQEP